MFQKRTLAIAAASALGIGLAVPYALDGSQIPGGSQAENAADFVEIPRVVELTNGDLIVKGVLADDAGTIIVIEFRDIDPSFDQVLFGPTRLLSASGESVPLVRHTSDSPRPFSLSLYFPAFEQPEHSWSLEVSAMSFNRLDEAGRIVSSSRVSGVSVAFEDVAITRDGIQATVLGGPQPLLHGFVRVDEVITTSSATVVRGAYEDIDAERLASMPIDVSLSDAKGMPSTIQHIRSGFGHGNARFEIRFDPISLNGRYSLSITARDAANQQPAEWSVESR